MRSLKEAMERELTIIKQLEDYEKEFKLFKEKSPKSGPTLFLQDVQTIYFRASLSYFAAQNARINPNIDEETREICDKIIDIFEKGGMIKLQVKVEPPEIAEKLGYKIIQL